MPPIGGSSLSPGYPSYPPSLGGGGPGGGYFGGVGGGGGGIEPHRPFNVRCDDGDGFKQVCVDQVFEICLQLGVDFMDGFSL